MKCKYVLYLCILYYSNVCAVSIVYNYRIAQVTKQPIFEEFHNNKTVLVLPFDQYQKKYKGDMRQNFVGGLVAFIYEFSQSGYIRADWAVSHVHETTHGTTTFSGSQTDDILFSFGGQLIKKDTTPLALSGLLGIPTHKILRLKHVDFGYGQASLGLQLDGSYRSVNKGTFVYGARYIYFIPRHAQDTLNQDYFFSIGNDISLLFAYKNNWNKHGFEIGYTERFQCGARISPYVHDIVKGTNYIRSNFYAVYKYKFLLKQIANRLLFNIGYGFDTSPKRFGNKYVLLFWGAWNVNF